MFEVSRSLNPDRPMALVPSAVARSSALHHESQLRPAAIVREGKTDAFTTARSIVEIRPGVHMRRIIIGTWPCVAMHPPIPEDGIITGFRQHAERGFDSFEIADVYSGVAECLGDYIRQCRCIRDDPTPRNLPTTVMATWAPESAAAAVGTCVAAAHNFASKLGVTSLDVFNVFWWETRTEGYVEVLKEAAELLKPVYSLTDPSRPVHESAYCPVKLSCPSRPQNPLVKCLGVVDFPASQLRECIDCGVDIAVDYVAMNVLDRRAVDGLCVVADCSNVKLVAYNVLLGGFLTDAWLNVKEPRPDTLRYPGLSRGIALINAWSNWANFQHLLSTLSSIGLRHGVSIAAVAIRWVLDQLAVAAVVVGSRIGGEIHSDDFASVFTFDVRVHVCAALPCLLFSSALCGTLSCLGSGGVLPHLPLSSRPLCTLPRLFTPQLTAADNNEINRAYRRGANLYAVYGDVGYDLRLPSSH